VVARLRAGNEIGDELTDLGVRWVVLVVAADEARYRALDSDPSLRLAVDGSTLRAYEHTDWRDDGVDEVSPFLARVDPPGPGRWSRPGGTWWLQGTEPVGTDRFGLAALPGGSSVLWFWPAVVVLAGDFAVLVALVLVLARLRSSKATKNLAK
jgi:hypothetical protein